MSVHTPTLEERVAIAEDAWRSVARELSDIGRSIGSYERRAAITPSNKASIEARVENVIEAWMEKAAAHGAGFFLVWSPTGKTPPTFRWDTREQAMKEAERLAGEHAGHEFFVLAALTKSHAPTSSVRTERATNDIPF